MRKSVYDSMTGQVVNVILLADGAEYTPPEGYALGPEAEIGDAVVNGEVVPQVVEAPPPPPPTLSELLNQSFSALPPEQQADFSPLKAAVKLELDQGNREIARLIIQRATIPQELEPLRTQMLSVFS